MGNTTRYLHVNQLRKASFVDHLKDFCSRKMFLPVALLAALTLSAAKAEAANWYVSKIAPAGGNGASWTTAWNELNAINWASVQSGDIIYIDGGQSGASMTYQTTLTVSASLQSVAIDASSDPARNGQIIIDGTNSTTGNGIIMQGANATITGSIPNRIWVRNFKNDGIVVQGSAFCLLNYLEISGNKTGVNASAPNVQVFDSILHDNGISVSSITSGALNLTNCWIYGSSYPRTNNTSIGVECAGGNVMSNIFGPGLSHGLVITPNETANTGVYSDLFIDASVANINIQGPGGGFEKVAMSACTSYMTKLNQNNSAHNAITANVTPGELSAVGCVFYNGVVNIPAAAGTVGLSNNFEYGVTGNTTTLAPSQIDPQFVDKSLYTFANNVPIKTLVDANYALSPTGPAIGSGVGQFTSVKVYLQDLRQF